MSSIVWLKLDTGADVPFDHSGDFSGRPYADLYCRNFPKDSGCDNVRGFYMYNPSMAANATFLALFAVSAIGFILTLALTRRTLVFSFALITGVVVEILGYAGRVWSSLNRWTMDPFLMQICCLTIAPAFMAAGIYLCLRRIVAGFGAENSRIRPVYYTRIFIPCDVVSLVLQAVGGAMASIASQNNESTEAGDNIMLAGLAFQVFTMFMFIVASVDFGLRAWRRYKTHGPAAFDQSPELVEMRSSLKFRVFLSGVAVATLLILWRSVFRVAELSGGWTGPIMADEPMFIGFEGVLIIVACLVLNVAHPAICAAPLFEGSTSKGSIFRRSRGQEKSSAYNSQSDLPPSV